MKCRKKLDEKVLARIFCVLNTVVFLVLFYYSLRLSGINIQGAGDEHIYFVPDSLIKNISACAAVWVVLCILLILYEKLDGIRWRGVPAAVYGVAALAMIFSVYWVGAANIKPDADQSVLCWLAESFNNGEFIGTGRCGYATVYRQQLGMITILRIIFDIFGNGNYRAFQYFSACMIPIIILCGYQIMNKISAGGKRAELCYLLFTAGCVPMYMYVPFVYGELCSTAFIMISALLILQCMERFEWWKVILLGISAGAAVQMRLNTIIIVIGFLIVIAVKMFHKVQWELLGLAMGMILGIVLFQGIVTGMYKDVIDEDGEPMPAILYIAMGINDENEHAGWWNGYNGAVFYENDCNVEVASDIAKEDLYRFAQKCIENPKYALNFYSRKINSQWNAPMYQCLVMNSTYAGKQDVLAEQIYHGKMWNNLEMWMNIYQLLLYLGVLAVSVWGVIKGRNIDTYILLIGIFGGFLFSIIWEAKTRYIFPYLLMLIPYASVGIGSMIRLPKRKVK